MPKCPPGNSATEHFACYSLSRAHGSPKLFESRRAPYSLPGVAAERLCALISFRLARGRARKLSQALTEFLHWLKILAPWVSRKYDVSRLHWFVHTN